MFRENAALSHFRTDKPDGAVITYRVGIAPSLLFLAENAVFTAPHEKKALIDGHSVRLLLRDVTDMPIVSEQIDNCTHIITVAESALSLWDSNLFLKLLRLPEKLFAHGEFFLHASMIVYRGKAILFTGHKQIGKSTQAALWEANKGAEVINGDRALLRKKDGHWYASGSPYCGTSKICKNGTYPLSAVVLLSQAKENTAVRASAHEAIAAFLDGCSFDPTAQSQTALIMDSALDIYNKTAVLKLACLPEKGAVDCLLAALDEI